MESATPLAAEGPRPQALCLAFLPLAIRVAHYTLRGKRVNPATREDAVQEAQLALWQAAVDWEPFRATFETHLFNRVRRAVQDFMRREARQTRTTLLAPEDLSLTAQAHKENGVEGVIPASLPTGDRDVLRMRYVEGASVPDVAARLGVGADRASYLIRKARAHLRTSLSAQAQYKMIA